MEAEGRSLQIDGKAVNAAQGDVSVDHQNIDQRKEHEINQNHQTSVVINNQYDKGIYERRMVPADHAASFIDQLVRAIVRAQSDDIEYDDRVGSHVRTAQADRLTEYISSLWNDTSPAVDNIKKSIRKFRTQILEVEIGKDNTPNLPHKSLEDSVTWVRASLRCAIAQSRDVYTTRRSTSIHLLDIQKHIYSYCYWIGLLRNQDKTCCLSDAFGCLISAIIGGVEIDPAILGCLSELAQIFYHAEDYLALCASRALSKSLHEETVQIFEALVTLLQELLECAWRGNKLSKNQKQNIACQAEELKEWVFEMNIKSKVLKNPIRANDLNTYHSGDFGLYVLREFKTFLNSATFENSEDCPSYRRRGGSLKAKVSWEAHDGPSPATVASQYLAHDQRRVMEDFEEAALPSNIESEQMRQLSALTKRKEFKDWLREDSRITMLLIHGGLEDSGTLSALSYLCARVPLEFLRRGHDGFVSLHYFCSLQIARGEHPANAYGIVRSFASQLLTNAELAPYFDLSFLDKKWLQGIQKQSFEATCRLFLRLLSQLDRKNIIIFCSIDSISLYETRNLRKDTEQLFATLRTYSKGQRGHQRGKGKHPKLIFKLLVTDAMATSYVYKYFRGPGEMLVMDGDDERDDNDVDFETLYG